jgi:Xaa-Pro aminopeptidase
MGTIRSVVTFVLLTAATGAATSDAAAQTHGDTPEGVVPQVHALPPLREQADLQQAWLAERLTTVLPALMRKHKVEMWILSMREYAEDPVFWSMRSPTTFAARRRSIYIFHDRGPEVGVDRIALGGTSQGGLYEVYTESDPWSDRPELFGDEQWRQLRQLIEGRDPRNIVLNIDEHHAFSDGLHAGEREALERALGNEYVIRVVRKPELAIDYIATRVPSMLPHYRRLQQTVHALISRAFSSAVITPGTTTIDDVRWWLREQVRDLGMTVWFHPSVSVQRVGEVPEDGPTVIEPGDLLWVDFGVVAMGLHTDTQHLGYVLRPGETQPPDGLRACLATSNRVQDHLMREMEPGRSGNEVLARTLAAMEGEGIEGTVYTHPIGDHGHGAGPLIGLWDHQEGVPVRGDLELEPNTWHSIELQARVAVPEWNGKAASCRQEEEAYLDETGVPHWMFRRQEDFHLVW